MVTGSSGKGDEGLRQMPRWADRYARNRALFVGAAVAGLSGMAISLVFALTLAVGVTLLMRPTVARAVLLAAGLVCCGVVVWFVRSGRLRELMRGVITWANRKEGLAAPEAPVKAETRADRVVGWVLMVLMCGTPMVCTLSGLPVRYLVPLAAGYTVPLMAYLCYRGQYLTPLMSLWPALFAAHALLVLAGVPLLTNLGPIMSVVAPMCGYQLVAVLVAHVYSRYSLRRLKAIAGEGGGGDGGE